jgi:hypothetical protein
MTELYLVSEGEVSALNEPVEWDGETTVLVLAESEAAALQAAADYDRGLLEPGNMAWNGSTIAVVRAAR